VRKTAALTAALLLLTGLSMAQNFENSEEQKISANITFQNDSSAKITDIGRIETERLTAFSKEGTHQIRVKDEEGETVFEGYLNIVFRTPKGFGKPGYETTSHLTRRLFIPLKMDATRLKVDGPYGTTEASILDSLCTLRGECTDYCQENSGKVLSCTCGDNICQQSTNETELCPQDCSIPQNNGNDGQNNSTDEQVKEVVDSDYSTFLLIAVIVIAVLIALFLLSGRVKIEA
jgi:hypothetical protein